ncbi:hypothetical protein JRQ81_002289 [Phrynocephalus forsythii]|uniref:Uncharacterized protein n=1 Tax=Phrynocephalus forsythii TaxID=171643 RepID=A0A9Q1AVV1_9SAUR|nr:hypothetical protein JRQ81_002289 [Phrynocephalus forsythii]
MPTAMAFSLKNPLKDRSLVSGNIGIPSHLISLCQWPAYTTHISSMVKVLVDQDKAKIERFLGTPRGKTQAPPHSTESSQAHSIQKKRSLGSQGADVLGPSPAVSRFSTTISSFGVTKDSSATFGGQGALSGCSHMGPSLTGSQLVIFSKRRAPLLVLPMKLPDASNSKKSMKQSLPD